MLYGDLKYFIWAFFHDGYEKKERRKKEKDFKQCCHLTIKLYVFHFAKLLLCMLFFFRIKKKIVTDLGCRRRVLCSFVTPWIYRPRTPIAVSLSAGSGVIVSSHSPSSALLAASEELRDDDITLSGAANEFSGVDHRPLSGPYGHQKHADESERCRCGKAKASPAVCTLCARCVHPWHG